MARVEIDLPEQFDYETTLDVLISQVNKGNHLGNDSIVGLLNEARLRYMKALGFEGGSMAGYAYINADLAVVYRAEAHWADKLKVQVSTANYGKYGCDFLFRISHAVDDREVARAKAAFLLYDYENSCLQQAPDNFEALMSGKA